MSELPPHPVDALLRIGRLLCACVARPLCVAALRSRMRRGWVWARICLARAAWSAGASALATRTATTVGSGALGILFARIYTLHFALFSLHGDPILRDWRGARYVCANGDIIAIGAATGGV